MKRIHISLFFIAILLEGLLAEVILGRMQFDAGRGQIVDYEVLRSICLVAIGFALVLLVGIWFVMARHGKWIIRICDYLDSRLIGAKKRLFLFQGMTLVLTAFLVELWLLTFLVIPVPLRPVLIWGVLICCTSWVMLRIIYHAEYNQVPSWASRLRAKWNGWLPIQRTTMIVLVVMGLIYFIGFIPTNYRLDANGHFYTHGDEAVIYPDVAKALVVQGTFSDWVQRVIWDWPWWYGFPYLPISAAVLVIPRLLLGNGFFDHIQLNIFLLRQLISVLPMVLAIILLVYLVNKFKSLWQSVGIFIFMALLPGVVKFNVRFWHPDSLILLLILFTFYCLQKDRLRYGKYFFLAAVTCGLATAIKLWGLFFVLAIPGYLLAGVFEKQINLKKMVLLGLGFILAMAGTIVISSPGLIIPAIQQFAIKLWLQQQNSLLTGYNEPDPEGVYKTGLVNWLRFFGIFFMKPFFFFSAFLALLVGSLWGARKYLNRLILAWSLPATLFLVSFGAMKSFQYMFPVMIPLYLGAFLLPGLVNGEDVPGTPAILTRPIVRRTVWVITVVLFVLQFGFNLVNLIHSPYLSF